MRLVARTDAEQDLHRLLDRRLLDHNRLEASLERGVALDVLAVLVEGGRADALQLAARQRRLEDVGGVDAPSGGARAHEHVDLIDEQDRVARAVSSSMTFLRRSSNWPRYMVPATATRRRAQHALVAQRLGHVAVDDALGQAFDDGGLADARLADQGGVVLGAPRQDLDDALDLLLATDDGIELACPHRIREVDAQLVDGGGLAGALGLLRGRRGARLGERPG